MPDAYEPSTVSVAEPSRGYGNAPLLRSAHPAVACAIAMLAAAASLALTGFQFGVINNLFHLPIVGALYNEPQFHDDAFIQSLRHYASGVWLLLDGSAHYVSPYWLFFTLDYLSRLLAFVGFLCCASLVGVTTTGERVIFVLILCFSSLLHGYSYPGNGGLFINYFTHSEVANGTILLAVFFASRGRFAGALTLSGVTFFINAFMAVWLLPLVGAIATYKLRRREITWAALARQVAIGAIVGAVIASPVLYNILSNPGAAGNSTVDARSFLLGYYPDHIFFGPASLRHKIALAVIALFGLLSFRMLGRSAACLAVALLASVLVFVVGIALPMLTGRLLFLNLHLIRSSSDIQLLAALGSACLTTKWLVSAKRNQARFFGPLLLIADCTWRSFVPLGFAAMVVAGWMQRRHSRVDLPRLDYAVVALLVLLIWPTLTWQAMATNQAMGAQTRTWQAIGAWARAATPRNSIFLVPTWYLPGETTPPVPPGEDDIVNLGDGSEIFEFTAQRRVWVDYRRGAAVLWTPSYYRTWQQRIAGVMALHSLAEKMAYASQHGISYVIDACAQDGAQDYPSVMRAGRLCVFAVSPGS